MKKIFTIIITILFCSITAQADTWECLTAEQATVVKKVVKKGGYIFKYMSSGENVYYDLCKLSKVELIPCGTYYNDPTEIYSLRIGARSIARWKMGNDGCLLPTNGNDIKYEIHEYDIYEVMSLNYCYVFSKKQNKFILVCDLYADYKWAQCKAFDAPSASVNGIKDAGYKKIAK